MAAVSVITVPSGVIMVGNWANGFAANNLWYSGVSSFLVTDSKSISMISWETSKAASKARAYTDPVPGLWKTVYLLLSLETIVLVGMLDEWWACPWMKSGRNQRVQAMVSTQRRYDHLDDATFNSGYSAALQPSGCLAGMPISAVGNFNF